MGGHLVGRNSLKVLYPSLFRIFSLKSRPNSDFEDLSSLQMGGSTNWNFHFSRNLLDREIIQLQELIVLLRELFNQMYLKVEYPNKGQGFYLVDGFGQT